MTRPAYNTGTGFYVGADKKLYDPSNQQFIPRGVNRTHYDDFAGPGITKSRATAERFPLYWDNFIAFGGTPTYISATKFSVTGNQTAFFYPNGRVRATVTAGTVVGTISAAVFTSLTTVTVSWDSGSLDSGLSAVAYGTRAADFVTQLYNECYLNGIVAIPVAGTTSSAYGHTDTTCSAAAVNLQNAVDQWVGEAAIWTASYQGIPTERWMLINIANEWGPSNSTTWRDSYITAISRMRSAGYLHTLVIDGGGCGQDQNDIINYAQAVFDSDPQKNVIFSIHLYGGNLTPAVGPSNSNNVVTNITKANPAVVTFNGPSVFQTNGWQIIITDVLGMTQVNSVDQNNVIYKIANVNVGASTFELHDINDSPVDSTGYSTFTSGGPVGVYGGQVQAASILQSLANTGLPILVGEFGAGRNIGPSPTMTWPGDVIRAANDLGVGWIAWAWDANNLGGGLADDNSLSLTYNYNVYNVPSDLTIYGRDVVLDHSYSLQVAGYRFADFTYSPGLQETPGAKAKRKKKIRGPYSDPRIYDDYIKKAIAARDGKPEQNVALAVVQEALVAQIDERQQTGYEEPAALSMENQLLSRLAELESKNKRLVSKVHARQHQIDAQLEEMKQEEEVARNILILLHEL